MLLKVCQNKRSEAAHFRGAGNDAPHIIVLALFVTATSYVLAKNLVNSMKTEVICQPNNLVELLQISLIDYNTAIKLAFDKIEQNQVISS